MRRRPFPEMQAGHRYRDHQHFGNHVSTSIKKFLFLVNYGVAHQWFWFCAVGCQWLALIRCEGTDRPATISSLVPPPPWSACCCLSGAWASAPLASYCVLDRVFFSVRNDEVGSVSLFSQLSGLQTLLLLLCCEFALPKNPPSTRNERVEAA